MGERHESEAKRTSGRSHARNEEQTNRKGMATASVARCLGARGIASLLAARGSAIPEGRRAFSSDKFRDKEIAEERMYFNKEDEKLLRGLLGKMKAQAECSDRTHKDKERSALIDIVGAYSMKSDDIEKLLGWRHRTDF